MVVYDLDHTPVRPPPPGQHSDFEHPVSRSYQLIILISVLSALVVAVILMRLYARLRVTKSFGTDDIFCIAGTVLVLSYSGLILRLLYYPGGGILGIHLWDVTLRRFIEWEKLSLADGILAQFTNASIKVGFLVFYLRLFGLVNHVRWMIWFGMTVIVGFAVIFFIIDLAACVPRAGETFASPSVSERCNNISVNLVTAGAYIRVVTDFYILFIPLHQLPSLKLSKSRRIGVTLIFLTGLLAAGAGLTNLIIRSDKNVFDKSDFTWTIVPVYATTLVELNIGIVCLSLPVIFILFVGRFTKLSKSLGSWIRERRSPRPSPHQSDHASFEHLAGGHSDEGGPPQLPPVSDTETSFSTRMRKFIRTIYRSQLDSTRGGDTTLGTFDDQATGKYDYHVHLKDTRPKQMTMTGSQPSSNTAGVEKR
ncbi:hypothetical protein F5Y09DRAFT_295119 [Xylaria sp. FL1042]|nr:hypothetical protein F5Y09DRAFT_295119 [Xylaria sp. FL1042]